MNNKPSYFGLTNDHTWLSVDEEYYKKLKPTHRMKCYTHPVKELNEAIKIIKDFQNSDVPPCKDYENTYADGWTDACNEILWAIEEKAQEK
jgi:DNA topoisomerase IB